MGHRRRAPKQRHDSPTPMGYRGIDRAESTITTCKAGDGTAARYRPVRKAVPSAMLEATDTISISWTSPNTAPATIVRAAPGIKSKGGQGISPRRTRPGRRGRGLPRSFVQQPRRQHRKTDARPARQGVLGRRRQAPGIHAAAALEWYGTVHRRARYIPSTSRSSEDTTRRDPRTVRRSPV